MSEATKRKLECLYTPPDDTRIAVVETKVHYIEQAINDNSIKLNDIDKKVDGISDYIARQNGTLPRLEQNINNLICRLTTAEKEVIQTQTKTKIVWAIFSAIITGIIMLVIKGTLF